MKVKCKLNIKIITSKKQKQRILSKPPSCFMVKMLRTTISSTPEQPDLDN